MNTEKHELSHEALDTLLEGPDEALRLFISSLPHPADIKDFLLRADVEHWPRIFSLIDDIDTQAELLSEMDEGAREELLPYLKTEKIAELAEEMDSDDAADLIGLLPTRLQHDALLQLPALERQQVQELLRYPEDSAGGIMQLEFAHVQLNATVTDAIARVRDLVENDMEVITVWVVDSAHKLIGSVELVDLLLNKTTTLVKDIMEPIVSSATPLVDQEEVASLFRKYDLLTLPVVDDNGRLLGRIEIDDIIDVLSEEADEDALHMGGTGLEELSHRESIFSTARIRLPWLSVALLCSLISAFLIHVFDPVLQEAIIIVSFLPVISAMGGNVGIQTATLLIRGLSSGRVDLDDIPKLLYKEIGASLVMGTFYGFGAGFVATFVLSNNNYYLGLVVCLAMISAMVTAAVLGVLAPSALKRLGVDPAIASGPFITTVNDITGNLIYLSICGLFLAYLR